MASYANALSVLQEYVLYCKKEFYSDMDEGNCFETTWEQLNSFRISPDFM